jgi:HlyD family type I secretion membrane fusion protein
MSVALKAPNRDYRRTGIIGLGIIAVTFGVFGIWAAFAPLGSAVIAHGELTADSNLQTVQHLEGGLINKILVHEGDHVQAGQILFQLDPVQTEATLHITGNQLFSLLAKRDRLAAERDSHPTLVFSPEVTAQAGDPQVSLSMANERSEFLQRQATLQSQIAVLRARMDEVRSEIQGIDTERASMQQQVAFLDDEIGGLNELYKQDLVPKPRLLALQRERAQLSGQIGRSISEKAKAEKAINETMLQIQQLQQQNHQDISKEIAEVETQSADLRQRFTVARDQSRRINVPAPMSGVAQNLHVFTAGAVVRPGDPLIDIAPDHAQMILQARIAPGDVDNVHAGQKVEVRFSSFHSRSIPVISGVIRTVSQDRLVDQATHTPYYLAIVYVSQINLPPELRGRLRAGLPADVIIPTGERTALQYVWSPLTNALHKSMREQ